MIQRFADRNRKNAQVGPSISLRLLAPNKLWYFCVFSGVCALFSTGFARRYLLLKRPEKFTKKYFSIAQMQTGELLVEDRGGRLAAGDTIERTEAAEEESE